MTRKAIIISVAVFLLLIGSIVFASKFCVRCERQTVKTTAAFASCSYQNHLSELRHYDIDSKVYIENRSAHPIKLSKVAFVGDKTGVIKEFVNESNKVKVAPLALLCFIANNGTIPAEEYERLHNPPSPGQLTENYFFHVEWEADTQVTPPKITAEIIKPALPLFYVPIMPDGSVKNCEVIDQL